MSRDKIVCFRTRFHRILFLTALIAFSFLFFKLRNNHQLKNDQCIWYRLQVQSSFKIRDTIVGAIFISWDEIFCFRTRFVQILYITALIAFFVWTLRGRPDLFLLQTDEVSLYLAIVHKLLTWYYKRMEDFKNCVWHHNFKLTPLQNNIKKYLQYIGVKIWQDIEQL